VVDLSSKDEDILPDTVWDVEFTKKLFHNLNRDLLGPLGDGKVIILSNSDEEEEMHDEIGTNTDVASSSTVRSPAPTASATNVVKAMPDDSNDSRSPDHIIGDSSSGRDEAGSP
jgi:hypothetical protein